MIDALFSAEEPKTGTDGTLSWTVDVNNPATGEDFVLGLKEITLPDGVTRPYSVWLSGNYPRALDGLTKLLSLDMRVLDPAWIGMKLRKLLNYPEPLGDFMAFVPGSRKQQTWPSTVAYIARLIIHRYAMLGILDENGFPLQQMGILEGAAKTPATRSPDAGQAVRRVRQPDGDPQGRLRLLHRLRRGGHLRLITARLKQNAPIFLGAFLFVGQRQPSASCRRLRSAEIVRMNVSRSIPSGLSNGKTKEQRIQRRTFKSKIKRVFPAICP